MNKILYVDIKFPNLTGTFVYREIEALEDAGFDITTVSMATPSKSHLSTESLPFFERTIYLDQVSNFKKSAAQFSLIFRRPVKFFHLLVLALRETEIKKKYDRFRILYHFFLTGYLFTTFKSRSFHHIHSPFLTGSASIAFFLSRYMNIPYSFTMHASNIYVNPLMVPLTNKLLF